VQTVDLEMEKNFSPSLVRFLRWRICGCHVEERRWLDVLVAG